MGILGTVPLHLSVVSGEPYCLKDLNSFLFFINCTTLKYQHRMTRNQPEMGRVADQEALIKKC